MMSKKLAEAFNTQMTAEFYSAHLYLQMAAYFEALNLPGFANWMRVQRLEEQIHAMKFFNHLIERGAKAKLLTIDAPPQDWASPLAAFEAAHKHELKVTSMVGNLVRLATAEDDHASVAFLQWFVTEQVEEEASTDAVVQKLKLVGEDSAGLFMLDRELATRVFTPPPGETGAPSAAPAA